MYKNGFTLFEVMIALAVIGVTVPALLTLSGALFKRVTKTRFSFEHVVALKNMLVEAQEKEWQQQKTAKKHDDALGDFTYTVKKIPEKSALASIKNLIIEQVEVQWHNSNNMHTDSLIYIAYKPEPTDAEKK